MGWKRLTFGSERYRSLPFNEIPFFFFFSFPFAFLLKIEGEKRSNRINYSLYVLSFLKFILYIYIQFDIQLGIFAFEKLKLKIFQHNFYNLEKFQYGLV